MRIVLSDSEIATALGSASIAKAELATREAVVAKLADLNDRLGTLARKHARAGETQSQAADRLLQENHALYDAYHLRKRAITASFDELPSGRPAEESREAQLRKGVANPADLAKAARLDALDALAKTRASKTGETFEVAYTRMLEQNPALFAATR